MPAFLNELVERAKAAPKTLVFPEGDDPRIRAAAERLAADGIARPVMISCDREAPAGVACIDPSSARNREKYASIYYERRRSRGITEREALDVTADPLHFASLALAAGDADGLVGGAKNSTGETVKALIHCVGVKMGFQLVSSFMVLIDPQGRFGSNGVVVYADPAVVPNPNSKELAEIAVAAAENAARFLPEPPRVALLSFSTKGSARHPLVAKVDEAMRIVQARAPELKVDGTLQADAALLEKVGASKAPGSPVAGRANVMVFPDLNAANIGIKLAERYGGGQVLGPFLQGLEKPGNDLSRGCDVDDVYYTSAMTVLQAGGAL